MSDWDPDRLPEPLSFGPAHYARVVVTWIFVAAVIYGLLVVFWLVRLFEWPLGRPVTPDITKLASRLSLRLMGIRLSVRGEPMREAGATVANHVSWLDILVMNSRQRVFFVAKKEVSKWFGIGILARTTGAVFIARDRRQARQQRHRFTERFLRGDTLLFFPEGTSTDGLRVLPFKPTLFAAMFDDRLKNHLYVQPATVNYRAPPGQDRRFYGFWGEMPLAGHMLKVLATAEPGSVELIYHEPVAVSRFDDRKDLARHCEHVVRSSHVSQP